MNVTHQKLNITKKILVCDSVKFYSPKDQDAFFNWIKKIQSINQITIEKKSIYLYLKCSRLNNNTLDNLLGLFYRYKIDMKQLARFLNKTNKFWFYDNKIAYWHKKVFGTTKKKT